MARTIIIHANDGSSYYPQGSARLLNSLHYFGWPHDVKIFNDWPNALNGIDRKNPWNIKACALAWARRNGYEVIIWADASIWAIRNPSQIRDLCIDRGLFTWRDGHTVAQTASDKALDYFRLTRKEASEINEVRSSVFGFDFRQPIGIDFYTEFISAANRGIFDGEKSVIPREFGNPWQIFASRQDQTVVSILRHLLHEKYKEPSNNCAIESDPGEYVIGCGPDDWERERGEKVSDSVLFAMRGI